MLKRLALGLLLIATPAVAVEPHGVKFNSVINDFDGNPLMDCSDVPAPASDRDCKTKRALTLGILAARSLLNPEQSLSADESLKRGELARKVYSGAELTLDVESLALIKRQIAKTYGPLIVAQTFPLLDPATKQ